MAPVEARDGNQEDGSPGADEPEYEVQAEDSLMTRGTPASEAEAEVEAYPILDVEAYDEYVPENEDTEGEPLLLVEVEHSVAAEGLAGGVTGPDTRLAASRQHLLGSSKGLRAPQAAMEEESYRLCADAAVASLCAMLRSVGFTRFSVLVNRRVLQPELLEQLGLEGLDVEFPRPPGSGGQVLSATGGRPPPWVLAAQAAAPTGPPPCSRARRGLATRYPRPGAFEVTVYDTVRGKSRILYSKYHQHELPTSPKQLWAPLLPFLLLLAGHGDDEELMNSVTDFANEQEILLDLPMPEIQTGAAGGSQLLDGIRHAIGTLHDVMSSGDPDVIEAAIQNVPHRLRTEDVVKAEHLLEHMTAVEDKVGDALFKIQSGLEISGFQSLQRALIEAEREGLQGRVLMEGLRVLHSATEGSDDEEEDDHASSSPRGSAEDDRLTGLPGDPDATAGRSAALLQPADAPEGFLPLTPGGRAGSTAGRHPKVSLRGALDSILVASSDKSSGGGSGAGSVAEGVGPRRSVTGADAETSSHNSHRSLRSVTVVSEQGKSRGSGGSTATRAQLRGLLSRGASKRLQAERRAMNEVAECKAELTIVQQRMLQAAQGLAAQIHARRPRTIDRSSTAPLSLKELEPEAGSTNVGPTELLSSLVTRVQNWMVQQREEAERQHDTLELLHAEHRELQRVAAERETQAKQEVEAHEEVTQQAEAAELRLQQAELSERQTEEQQAKWAAEARASNDAAVKQILVQQVQCQRATASEEAVVEALAREGADCSARLSEAAAIQAAAAEAVQRMRLDCAATCEAATCAQLVRETLLQRVADREASRNEALEQETLQGEAAVKEELAKGLRKTRIRAEEDATIATAAREELERRLHTCEAESAASAAAEESRRERFEQQLAPILAATEEALAKEHLADEQIRRAGRAEVASRRAETQLQQQLLASRGTSARQAQRSAEVAALEQRLAAAKAKAASAAALAADASARLGAGKQEAQRARLRVEEALAQEAREAELKGEASQVASQVSLVASRRLTAHYRAEAGAAAG